MRYLVLLLCFLLLTGCPQPKQEMTIVNIVPSKTIVAVGEEFDIEIKIDPSEPVVGAQVRLNFNGSVIRIDSISQGNLGAIGETPTFFMPGTITPTSVGDIAEILLGSGKSVSSPFMLARLYATAIGEGMSDFSATVIIPNMDSEPVPFGVSFTNVDVASPLDVNLDGVVNLDDLVAIYEAFGEISGREDVKADGIVNILDMVMVAQGIS